MVDFLTFLISDIMANDDVPKGDYDYQVDWYKKALEGANKLKDVTGIEAGDLIVAAAALEVQIKQLAAKIDAMSEAAQLNVRKSAAKFKDAPLESGKLFE